MRCHRGLVTPPRAAHSMVVHYRPLDDEPGHLSAVFDAQGVVDVFEERRVVTKVETAALEVLVAAHEPARGRGVVDVAAEQLRLVASEHFRTSDRGRSPVVVEQLTCLLERAIGVEQDRRRDTDPLVIERGDQRLEPTRPDDRVRVQEAQVGALGMLDAELVATSEPEVLVGCDQDDTATLGAEEGHARIAFS